MIWGYAGVWYGPFQVRDGQPVKDEPEATFARLEFLRRYGLQCLHVGLRSLTSWSAADLDRLGATLAEHDLHLTLGVGYAYLTATDDEIARAIDDTAALLDRFAALVRCPLAYTTPRAGHRFDRQMPVEAKLARLSRSLAPLALLLHQFDLPFGIENHGDFYVSDLVELCRATPHLGLFLDTGNTYLIGERPLPAYEVGAPYVVGTHFKDHLVAPRPEARPLHFEVGGAVLGEGDAHLREAYDLILRHAPQPDRLVMEIEFVTPEGAPPLPALERSLEFIRSLG